LAIIGKPIKLSFRVSNIALWAKKQEKRPILNVGPKSLQAKCLDEVEKVNSSES
ncbi:MAG: hypothetical protein, partial [Olavius algarvensis Gamma 1 endosymbiont]